MILVLVSLSSLWSVNLRWINPPFSERARLEKKGIHQQTGESTTEDTTWRPCRSKVTQPLGPQSFTAAISFGQTRSSTEGELLQTGRRQKKGGHYLLLSLHATHVPERFLGKVFAKMEQEELFREAEREEQQQQRIIEKVTEA